MKKLTKKKKISNADIASLSVFIGQIGMFRTAHFDGHKYSLVDGEWLQKEIKMLTEIVNRNL
ncbi:MAG: hypothetical protein AAB456_00045 [Patescibacteria group bacterium]